MADLERALIYGATGYTGRLIAELAKRQGARPILAGRTAETVGRLAERLELPHRVFGLDDPDALDAGLADVDVVVHCAGPFERMAPPMVDACLRTGTHYTDITGEVTVFEALARRGGEAEAAGVMLMPGVGFDIVPTDCLAMHLKARLPDATELSLAFLGMGTFSHGTATTMVENLGRGSVVRRGGELVRVPAGRDQRRIDFGPREATCVAIPWGDLSTAYVSTGIPDITVYMAAPSGLRLAMRATNWLGGALRSGPVQRFLKGRVDAAPAGPTASERDAQPTLLWGEVRDAAGEVRTTLMQVSNGYTFTADAALIIARRIAAGQAEPGFRTPSMVYGPDLVLEVPGSERTDV